MFKQSAAGFYVKNYSYIAFFAGALLIMERIKYDAGSNLAEFMINGAVSIVVSIALLLLVSLIDRDFRDNCRMIMKQVEQWISSPKGIETGNR